MNATVKNRLVATIGVLATLIVIVAVLLATHTIAWYGGLHTPNAGITTPWGGFEFRGIVGFFGPNAS
jgi:hypothetical protein